MEFDRTVAQENLAIRCCPKTLAGDDDYAGKDIFRLSGDTRILEQ